MRLIEATTDYSIAIKQQLFDSLRFVTLGLLIVSTPLILVFIIGLISYISILGIGYFVFLSLISPRTAEKIIKNVFIPKMSSTEVREAEETEE